MNRVELFHLSSSPINNSFTCYSIILKLWHTYKLFGHCEVNSVIGVSCRIKKDTSFSKNDINIFFRKPFLINYSYSAFLEIHPYQILAI